MMDAQNMRIAFETVLNIKYPKQPKAVWKGNPPTYEILGNVYKSLKDFIPDYDYVKEIVYNYLSREGYQEGHYIYNQDAIMNLYMKGE